jgi:hypothetical protein
LTGLTDLHLVNQADAVMLVVDEMTMHELTLPDRSTGRVDTAHDTLADESVGFRRKAADNLTTIILLFIPFLILFHAYIFVDREATGARLEGSKETEINKKTKQKKRRKTPPRNNHQKRRGGRDNHTGQSYWI